MARRRMIDPNFWESEDVAKLSIRQRLLLIGLFSNADDYGRGRANPTFIRSMVFPYDDLAISEIESDLEDIETATSIKFYTTDSSKYYEFLNWDKWQTVQKPQPSKIPAYKDCGLIQESVENDSGMVPESVESDSRLKERKGKEVKGKEESFPAPDSNPHKDRIHALVNQCQIQNYSIFDLDELFSYIGMVDIEVIEAAIKKGSGKQSLKYAISTLKGMINDGTTKKEQLFPKQVISPFPQLPSLVEVKAEEERKKKERQLALRREVFGDDVDAV